MSSLPDRTLTREVLKISKPAIAGMSSQMVVSVVETAMVGRLENTTVVLAAMGLGVLATWAVTSVFSSLATGTTVLAARRFGERDAAGSGGVSTTHSSCPCFLVWHSVLQVTFSLTPSSISFPVIRRWRLPGAGWGLVCIAVLYRCVRAPHLREVQKRFLVADQNLGVHENSSVPVSLWCVRSCGHQVCH